MIDVLIKSLLAAESSQNQSEYEQYQAKIIERRVTGLPSQFLAVGRPVPELGNTFPFTLKKEAAFYHKCKYCLSSSVVRHLFHDLRDGRVLIRLISRLTNIDIKPEIGNLRVHHIENINKVLEVIRDQGVKLVNVDSNDIAEGNKKLTLALIWSIILNWQVNRVLKDAKVSFDMETVERALLEWCSHELSGYDDLRITDFSNSWQDGRAFLGLVHYKNPRLFNYSTVVESISAKDRLDLAFKLANQHYGIERILDSEDFEKHPPDSKSIMTYVMSFLQSRPLTNKEKISDVPSKDMDNQSRSSSTVDVWIEVSSQLIESLAKSNKEASKNTINKIQLDLVTAKEQFRLNEEKMLRLTNLQNEIESALINGTRILNRPDTSQKDQKKVKSLMHSISVSWELIRNDAMSQQHFLQDKLQKMQKDEIVNLDRFIDTIESELLNLNKLPASYKMLKEQMNTLQSIQRKLESKQKLTSELQKLVLVDCDGNHNGRYEQTDRSMASKLEKVLDRWSAAFRFVDNRLLNVQEALVETKEQQEDLRHCEQWLDHNEWNLNQRDDDNCTIAKLRLLLQKARSRDEHIMSRPDSLRSGLERIVNLEARLNAYEARVQTHRRRINSVVGKSGNVIKPPLSIAYIIQSATNIGNIEEKSSLILSTSGPQNRNRYEKVESNYPAAKINETCIKFSEWLNRVDDIIREDQYEPLDKHEKYFVISDLLQKFDNGAEELSNAGKMLTSMNGSHVSLRKTFNEVVKRFSALRSIVESEKKSASLASQKALVALFLSVYVSFMRCQSLQECTRVDLAYVLSELDPIRRSVEGVTIGSGGGGDIRSGGGGGDNGGVSIAQDEAKNLKDRLAYLSMLVNDMERGHGEESTRSVRVEISQIDQKLSAVIG
ncbi:hypothetical protein ACOME3_009920 [Neoechinorhynchus agilis]